MATQKQIETRVARLIRAVDATRVSTSKAEKDRILATIFPLLMTYFRMILPSDVSPEDTDVSITLWEAWEYIVERMDVGAYHPVQIDVWVRRTIRYHLRGRFDSPMWATRSKTKGMISVVGLDSDLEDFEAKSEAATTHRAGITKKNEFVPRDLIPFIPETIGLAAHKAHAVSICERWTPNCIRNVKYFDKKIPTLSARSVPDDQRFFILDILSQALRLWAADQALEDIE